MNKVGVIGCGCVGSGLLDAFLKLGVEAIGYDKYKEMGGTSMTDMMDTDAVFLCLPTLNGPDGHYDTSSIIEVCQILSTMKYQGLVVLKSTVQPGTTVQLAQKFLDLKLLHNPEFLNARTSTTDCLDQKHVVIGYTDEAQKKGCALFQFYKRLFPKAQFSLLASNASELMKIGVNSFYAVKVAFLTEFAGLCESFDGVSYSEVLKCMLKNGRINHSHTNVPGPDGLRYYGGMCLPKDSTALLASLMDKSLPCETTHGAVMAAKQNRNDEEAGCSKKRRPHYTKFKLKVVSRDGDKDVNKEQQRLIDQLKEHAYIVDDDDYDIQIMFAGNESFSVETFDSIYLLNLKQEDRKTGMLLPRHLKEEPPLNASVEGQAVSEFEGDLSKRCQIIFGRQEAADDSLLKYIV